MAAIRIILGITDWEILMNKKDTLAEFLLLTSSFSAISQSEIHPRSFFFKIVTRWVVAAVLLKAKFGTTDAQMFFSLAPVKWCYKH